MSNSLTILVTGASGKQGGAVLRSLSGKGHRLRAMTRKPDSNEARELKKGGVEIVSGNFDERLSVERAARGADVVFAMSTPYEAGTSVEVSQGFGLLNACKSAGVQRIIYSSVAAADRKTGIPHFDSKARIEQHLSSMGVSYTIIAPVFFMENLVAPWMLPSLREGRLQMALPPTRRLQMIAVQDIGAFVAVVLQQPDRFQNKRVELASDEVTGASTAEVLSRTSGKEIEYGELPLEQVRANSDDIGRMYEWFREVGYTVDIQGLRRDYPDIGWHTLEQWASAQDWSMLKPTSNR